MKNEMKKTVSLILALMLCCTVLFGLSSCSILGGDTGALNDQIESLTKQLEDANAKILALEADKGGLSKEKEELIAAAEALRDCLEGVHTFSGAICTTCGKDRGYTRDGDFIYFGEYPQTIKADDVTITDTTDSRGYYLGSDGNYYAKVTATPYVDGMAADPTSKSTFTTGERVVDGTVYYFKVEPIRWRIITEENGEAFLLCDSIIANVQYQSNYSYDSSARGYCTTSNGAPSGTYANNYKYSDIRNWLNEAFYKTAFSSLQQAIVLATEVDNSAASTNPSGVNWDSGYNNYACENTNDKVFLISELEATSEANGFAYYTTSDEARRMLTSDYSRATGAYMDTSSDYNGNGWWCTRSPYYQESRNVSLIGQSGSAFFPDDVANLGIGVAPALRIKL